MSSLKEFNSDQVKERRRQLKRQRRQQLVVNIWRSLFPIGLVVSMYWLCGGINLSDARQVQVKGYERLSPKQITSLLKLKYPFSIITVSPQDLQKRLRAFPGIQEVFVTRRLVPAEIVLQVQERVPVAQVISSSQGKLEGFLDKEGVFIPKSIYQHSTIKLPPLTVVGGANFYETYWPEVYKKLMESKVKIGKLDWQDPNKVILYTELGKVLVGAYNTEQFSLQLDKLSQMQQLAANTRDKVAYIDLTIPDAPTLEIK